MIKYFIAGLFCLLSLFIAAQDQFLVYSIKGEVTFVEENKSGIVKNGKAISSNSFITIPEEGGITLICKEGGFYSLSQPGIHSLSKIRDSCNKSNIGVLNNFAKYLWDQAIKQSPDPGKNRKAYFDYSTARSRDVFDIWVSPAYDTLNYSGVEGTFPIYWKSHKDAKKYEFLLYAAGNAATPIYRTVVRDLKIPVVALAHRIKPGNTYYWSVCIRGEEDDVLYVLNYVTSSTFAAALTNISKQKPAIEGPAEEAFRTAFMLENGRYLAEACVYYAKAAGLGAENTLYNSALLAFRKDYEMK